MSTKNKPDIIYGNVSSTDKELDINQAKTRITMFVDYSVLVAFKMLAKTNGAKYQTLMNKTLRDFVENLAGGGDNLYGRVQKLEQTVFGRKKSRKKR